MSALTYTKVQFISYFIFKVGKDGKFDSHMIVITSRDASFTEENESREKRFQEIRRQERIKRTSDNQRVVKNPQDTIRAKM